jgi:Terminase large subunit, T4likevirus-type, N-terminal
MIRLKEKQLEVFTNPCRFRMLAAGRRFGKTYLAQTELLRAASAPGRIAWYVGPNHKQAKRVVWDSLKEMSRPFWRGRPSETDLRIELSSGGTIAVRGADAYDSLRGEGLDFVVLDEFASMAPAAWHSVLRPMLADRQGEALFIGTPQGFNHFYDLYTAADEHPDWATFHFTTEQGGNVTREELAAAARQMDERLYRQEFRADFEELRSGRVYPDFDRKLDVQNVEYDPNLELCWTLDFNIGFPCSLLCQIVKDRVVVFDEIALADLKTDRVCAEFERKLKPLWEARGPDTGRMDVRVFGDATGNNRKSSAGPTDWQTIRDFFKDHHIVRDLHIDRPSSNPRIIDRIHCVNRKIRNFNGERRVTISPRCKSLIRDLEQVCWTVDAHGNKLNEPDDKGLTITHASDALGYLIARKFPMRIQMGEKPYSIVP